MIAPIFCRTQIRSMISGSTAALRSSVTPSARTAVEQHLLGGADARVRQLELGAVQPVRRGEVQPLRRLVDDRAELAQRLQVEVDRARADVAAAQVGDERVAEPVQQRAAEQDRDPAGAGVHVDLVDVGAARRWPGRRSARRRSAPSVTLHAVQLQQAAHDLDVADRGHVEQPARRLAEQRRDHRLGDEVLGAAYPDLPVQRRAAVHDQDVVGQRNLQPGERSRQ